MKKNKAKDQKRKDVLTKAQRSFCMSQIRSRDTKIEIALRSALHRSGLRFRKNVRSLPGKPDIVFPKAQVAVFIDGNFWHGHNYLQLKKRLSPFWAKKIYNNIKRDKKNHKLLKDSGWVVLRFWEEQTWKQMEVTVQKIRKTIKQRQKSK